MIRCYFVLLSSNKDFAYLFTRRLLSLSWNTLFCFLSWYAHLRHRNNYSPWGKDTWAPLLWLIIKRCHIHRVVVGLSEQTLCLFAKRDFCLFFLVLFFRSSSFFHFSGSCFLTHPLPFSRLGLKSTARSSSFQMAVDCDCSALWLTWKSRASYSTNEKRDQSHLCQKRTRYWYNNLSQRAISYRLNSHFFSVYVEQLS